MKRMSGWAGCLMCAVILSLQTNLVAAQGQRDPTVPPAGAGSLAGTPAQPGSGMDLLGKGGYSIIVRDGKPFLAVGTRLYAPGQKLGSAVIERISETEILLREGRELRKVSQFSGIQRKVVSAGAQIPTPACAASAPKAGSRAKIPAANSPNKAPRVTACADDQP